jgi:hypothetical protein
MKCARCNRPLKNASPSGLGPKCAQAVLGTKPRRRIGESIRTVHRDERTQDLFSEARA